MNLKLDGKRALVTGASAGIGSAIAEVLAREGARVLVHGRNSTRIRAVVDRIASAGGKAVAIEGDLATDDGAAVDRWGEVSLVQLHQPWVPGAQLAYLTLCNRSVTKSVTSWLHMVETWPF